MTPSIRGEGPITLVLTTEADPDRAEALAGRLLELGLAACVSLHPLTSHYVWQGRRERNQEVQLLIKTHPSRLEPLKRALQELHSYTTPEWIHWTASAGGDYAAWVAASTGVKPGDLRPGEAPPDQEARPAGAGPAG